MKFPALTYLVAGVSIAQHVAASPLRVVVVTGYQEVSTNVRIGHEENHDPSLFSPIPPSFIEPDSPIRTSSRRRPCHAASSISDKTLEITNAFRKWLGLPVVHKDSKEDATAELVRILPVMPVKTYGVDGKDTGANRIPILPMGWSHLPPHDGEHREEHHDEHHGKHHGKHHKKHHDRPFWKRVHHALMSLGPWEGRAVAFVLGCGIGVLLRMMFVLIVLSYRMIRGEPEHPEIEFVEVLYDDYADAENLLVPPPQYVCEGAELVDAKEVKAEVKDEAKDVAEDETKNNEA